MPGAARKSLLVTTSSFPRWANDTDPRFVEELCATLAADFEVTVVAPHCRGAARRETLQYGRDEVEVVRYRYAPAILETLTYDGGIAAKIRGNPLRLLLVPLLVAAQFVVLVKHLRTGRFDVLHAHWAIPQGFVAALARALPGCRVPLLLTVHGSDLATLNGPLTKRVKRRILRAADRVTAVSNDLGRQAVGLGADPGRIVVLPMGVDLRTRFRPDPARARSGILCVGKLTAAKGGAVLVRALAALAPQHADVGLTFVGDGPERDALGRLAASLGIADRVVFAGAVPQEALPDHLQTAAVVAVPSLREGLGLVAVEALGCGCAVVASDLAALGDVISDGETGLLVTPGDAGAFAAGLERLLDDAALRERLGTAGRAAVLARFDRAVVGRGYADVIAELG